MSKSGKNGSRIPAMPVSEDAEKGLVCSLLLGGDQVAVELTVPAQAFYIPANQLVWETANDLVIEKRPLDFRIVKHRLDRLDVLEEIGGPEYLDALYSFLPSGANAKYYADIVLDFWRQRNAIQVLTDLVAKIRAPESTWDLVRGEVESGLVELIQNNAVEREFTAKELTNLWYDELSERKERLAREGIGFGLRALDKRLGMQQPGELVVIAARTSGGKSMLAYQGVMHNCWTRQLPVGVISLEMTYTQTWDRLASHIKKVPMNRFRDGDFADSSQEKNIAARLAEFHANMVSGKVPFYFCNRRLDIDGIKSWARRIKARYGIRLLVIDYLQRVMVPIRLQKASRQEQVSYISNAFKDLALELGIVIWCPAQLNKEGDVRESMAIEMDADISIHIDVPEKGGPQIVFQKVRQGAATADSSFDSLPIKLKGWVQTIDERTEEKSA